MFRCTLTWLALTACGVAGCASAKPASTDATGVERPVTLVAAPHSNNAPDKIDHQNLPDTTQVVMQLDIYQLTVPVGSVSGDSRFWRYIDEDHVDLATHQSLEWNGVRFGIGSTNDWDYFKALLNRYGAVAQKGSTAPTKKGTLELPMRTNLDEQTIFFFDDSGRLSGRDYLKCDNLLSISFEPTPRQPGNARIEICPLVRGLRKQFEVTIMNDERDIEFRQPEYLFDQRLREDVPMDHFLVIAPSAQAKTPSLLGHSFLVKPGITEPMETVLLLVPRPYRVTGETTHTSLNHGAIPGVMNKPK